MTAVWIGIAFSVLALIAVGVGAWHDYRTNTRTWTDEAAESDRELADSDYLAPHAKWLSQHDIDRQFNAIAAAEEARQ